MKYIRTKNGIYQIENNEHIVEMGVKVYIGINEFNNPTYEPIIAQADTVEELCDEFVVVNNTCFNTPQLLGLIIDKDYYKHEEVYGAIWTSKGLIYVAKLNDKGELELI